MKAGNNFNDYVLSIPSIQDLHNGFSFFSKHPNQDIHKMIIQSRLVGIIGDANSLPFLRILLLGRSPPTKVCTTPGIAINRCQETELTLVEQIHGDQTLNHSNLNDKNAIETVQQGIILEISQKVVFVVQRFDGTTQKKLFDLMEARQTKYKHSVWDNPIIVVHNRTGTTHLDGLRSTIKEVATCYQSEYDSSGSDQCSDYGWKIIINNFVYQTRFSLHVFLMAHQDKGFVHNLETIEILESLLKDIPVVPHQFIPKLIDSLTNQLPRVLEEWDPETWRFQITPDTESPHIAWFTLATIPTEQEGPEYWKKRKLNDGKLLWLDELEHLKGVDPKTPLKLSCPRTSLTGSVRQLEGSWFVKDKPVSTKNEENQTELEELVIAIKGLSFSQLDPENTASINYVPSEGYIEFKFKFESLQPQGFVQHFLSPSLPNQTYGVYSCQFPKEFELQDSYPDTEIDESGLLFVTIPFRRSQPQGWWINAHVHPKPIQIPQIDPFKSKRVQIDPDSLSLD